MIRQRLLHLMTLLIVVAVSVLLVLPSSPVNNRFFGQQQQRQQEEDDEEDRQDEAAAYATKLLSSTVTPRRAFLRAPRLADLLVGSPRTSIALRPPARRLQLLVPVPLRGRSLGLQI